MKKNKNINLGIRWFFLGTLILFIVLISRISYLQLSNSVEGLNLKSYVDENYNTTKIYPAKRGTIYDRNGIPLAEDVVTYTVTAILDPIASKNSKVKRHVVDKERTASELSNILNMKKSEVLNTLEKPKYQVEFGPRGKNISITKKEAIEKLKLPGIVFTPTPKRFYPNGVFASHILGYSTITGDGNITGELGLEKTLNGELKGKDGKSRYLRDRQGNIYPYENGKIEDPQNGNDIYLTIDSKIQSLLEDAMTNVENQYHPEKIMAIVADPKTGKILAMGNRPSFNPNLREIKNYTNDPISYALEAGSTMKIFTLGAAINEGVYDGNEYFQSGQYHVPGGTIHDINRVGWGSITFNEGIQHSSNVGISILLNEKIGVTRYLEYYKKFGFTKKTGINLPGEVDGSLVYKYPLEQTTTAFGQGSTTTSIQIIQAASAIANDGKMMKPYLVDKIVNPDTKKIVKNYNPEIVGNPITAETAQKEREILETVITAPAGTGHRYAVKGYSVAGKTGTAQVVSKEGKYLKQHGENLFSFIGMVPTNDPQLLFYIAVLRPKLNADEAGSEPVSKIFQSTIKGAFGYLKADKFKQKESPIINEDTVIPEFTGLSINEAKVLATSYGLKPISLGNGNVVTGQSIGSKTSVIKGIKIYFKTNKENKMPTILGWSKSEVRQLSNLFNLKLTVKGSGFTVKQSIKLNSVLKENEKLVVELK